MGEPLAEEKSFNDTDLAEFCGFNCRITTVRLKAEQNQLVSVASGFDLRRTGLQGAY